MLSLFTRKKSGNKSETPVTGDLLPTIIGSEALSISSQDYALAGFSDAVTSEQNLMRYIPEVNLTNAVVAVNFASTTASTVTNMLSNEAPSPITQTQLIGNLLTWALSGGAQLLQYFNKFKKLQDASLLLVKGLPMDSIAECFANVGEKRVELEKPFTPELISKFLKENGVVTIVFVTPDTSIDLYDFGISTGRVGGTAAVASLATAATQTISIGYFLAIKFGLITNAEQASALQTAANITSNVPLISFSGKLVETCNCYTQNFLRSLNTVVTKLFIEPKKLHEISEEILMVAEQYVSAKHMLKNRKFINQLKVEALDLESGTKSVQRLKLTNGAA